LSLCARKKMLRWMFGPKSRMLEKRIRQRARATALPVSKKCGATTASTTSPTKMGDSTFTEATCTPRTATDPSHAAITIVNGHGVVTVDLLLWILLTLPITAMIVVTVSLVATVAKNLTKAIVAVLTASAPMMLDMGDTVHVETALEA
jgi:hypothetical protein